MMWSSDGWWMFGWGLHWVTPLLILVAVVWFVVRMARSGVGPRGNGALAILRERYARGELTREQFEQMRGDLHA